MGDFLEQCQKILFKIFNGDQDLVQDGLEHILKFSLNKGTPKTACYFAKLEIFKKLKKQQKVSDWEVYQSDLDLSSILVHVSEGDREILLSDNLAEIARGRGVTRMAISQKRKR